MSSECTVELERIAHGGEAIGRWQGKVVFVPYAIPGERVRVRIAEEKRSYARAELLEVLDASPDRVEAPCPYFGRCGGCQWQHVSYQRQLDLRLEVVTDSLRRLGHVAEPPVAGIVPSDDAWLYRNNVQLHTTGEGQLGFVTIDGRTVMPIAKCLIAHELLDDMYASLDFAWRDLERLTLRAGASTGEQLVLLETRGEEAPELEIDLPISFVHMSGEGKLTPLVGEPHIYELVGERSYRISAPSFFQVNTAQAANLVEVVREFCALQGGERVLDLYCGVGTLSLALAERAAEVVGVESSPWSAADADVNGADVPSFSVLEGMAEEVLPRLEGPFQVLVVDPPRNGCGRAVLDGIVDLAPQRLVYVSCDPATLARDTAYLAERGLQLESMVAVDMFPQTAHVETVAAFSTQRSAFSIQQVTSDA